MVELVALYKTLLALVSGFVIAVICVLAIWRLLPKALGVPVYDLIGKGKKGAGYYYVFAGLVTAGTVIFSLQFGGELELMFAVQEAVSRFLLALAGSVVGIAISMVISVATMRLCDYATTQIKEWDLIKGGNEAAGLYFIGTGLVVFSVLLSATLFPRI